MGKPAARLGDMTAHGGVIVAGFPMVLIGGMPAARISDMHVCPMMNPGPSPHVGGPVNLGSPMVLIGGMPAARIGDLCICAGPPDTIAMGCPTVLIGEGGSGASGAGGAGTAGGGSAAARASAAVAQFDNSETATMEEHWVVFEFVDTAGNPVSGVPYEFSDPYGNLTEGTLRLDGKIRRDGINAGQCTVQLFSVFNAKWSKDKANVGEKVKLSAEVEGFEDGTPAYFEINCRDLKGADAAVTVINTEVNDGKVGAEWEYVLPEYEEDSSSSAEETTDYSAPQYYFDVVVEPCKARSGILEYKDYLEIELKDSDGKGIPNEEYILYLSNGEVRNGKLDHRGQKKENNVPPCAWDIAFPHLKGAFEQT